MEENINLYESRDFKRSRIAYKWECAFEYFVSLMVADSLLAKLLTSIGFSDAETGILSSFISLAFLFQIISIFVIRKITNTKRFAVLFHSLGQIVCIIIFLVPFMPFAKPFGKAFTVVCILVAYFGNYMVATLIYRWGNSFVEPTKRGRFNSGKEMLSLLTGVVVSITVGIAVDKFEKAGNAKGSFLFIAIAVLIFFVCDLAMLLLMKNEIKPRQEKEESVPMRVILKNTLGNKSFRNIIILAILWNCARYITVGFLGTYKTEDLAYTMTVIQVINIAACLARALISKPFGKYSDKRTFAKGIELGLVIAAVAFFSGIFATPETRFFIIVHTVLFHVCMAGVEGNFVNVTYSYVDSRYFAEASAIKNCISGVFGFGASLIGGKILATVQANNNTLFGYTVYGQQILFAISFVLILCAILFAHFVVGKQKVMIQ